MKLKRRGWLIFWTCLGVWVVANMVVNALTGSFLLLAINTMTLTMCLVGFDLRRQGK